MESSALVHLRDAGLVIWFNEKFSSSWLPGLGLVFDSIISNSLPFIAIRLKHEKISTFIVIFTNPLGSRTYLIGHSDDWDILIKADEGE